MRMIARAALPCGVETAKIVDSDDMPERSSLFDDESDKLSGLCGLDTVLVYVLTVAFNNAYLLSNSFL
jgi:hypothetical protein